MRIRAVSGYLKECFIISAIKFVIIPITITSAAYFMGLGTIKEGLLLKVGLVLSVPRIYDLDVDLANSCWLFYTGCLVIVVPILYYLVNLI